MSEAIQAVESVQPTKTHPIDNLERKVMGYLAVGAALSAVSFLGGVYFGIDSSTPVAITINQSAIQQPFSDGPDPVITINRKAMKPIEYRPHGQYFCARQRGSTGSPDCSIHRY